MEYWSLIENPADAVYDELIKLLCDYSDSFYLITRRNLKFDQGVLNKLNPYLLNSYQTNKWANTIATDQATVYVFEANWETCLILQQLANSLYDWVAPELPEDLTFIKNNFEWFTCTTHEQFGGFSIRSAYYRNLILHMNGLKIECV